ncbi:MAG TPA: GH25 family lysozyme [Streptosporangiaceae bacterium]|nr:GH25 family lysozyme [Streptosporangiaceae bacterium]
MQGVDVSSFQGAPTSWAKNAGAIQWAAVKITELQPPGSAPVRYTNPDAAADWAYLKRHGLVRVAYLFGHPSVNAAATVSFFAEQLDALGVEDGDAVALDHEVTDGLRPAAVSAWAVSVLGDLRKTFGRTPLIYTFLSFATEGNCAGLGSYPLWMADPSSAAGHPRVPAPWRTWALHQYATSGNIDRDVSSYATPAAMRAALGKGTPVPKKTRKDPEMILVQVDRAGVPAGTAWPGVFLLASDGSLHHVTGPEDHVDNVESYRAAGIPGPATISWNEYQARLGTGAAAAPSSASPAS